MAIGHPDYFGQSSFFKFGFFREHPQQVTTIEPGVPVKVFDIDAKGKIYSLYISIAGLGSPDALEILITVDDDLLLTNTLEDIWDKGFIAPGGYPLYIKNYKIDEELYTVSGFEGITFDSHFEIVFDSGDGTDFYCTGAVMYAEVV